jgi:hypothetical protein
MKYHVMIQACPMRQALLRQVSINLVHDDSAKVLPYDPDQSDIGWVDWPFATPTTECWFTLEGTGECLLLVATPTREVSDEQGNLDIESATISFVLAINPPWKGPR